MLGSAWASLSGVYCAGAGLSEGRVDALWGRTACWAAGLLSATDAGPPAAWEGVLNDAMLAMARGQSGYRPSPRRVWSESQDIDPDHDWDDELVKMDE